jgi:hypothetical protein
MGYMGKIAETVGEFQGTRREVGYHRRQLIDFGGIWKVMANLEF